MKSPPRRPKANLALPLSTPEAERPIPSQSTAASSVLAASAAPAFLADEELRETLDLMGKVLAQLDGRMESQEALMVDMVMIAQTHRTFLTQLAGQIPVRVPSLSQIENLMIHERRIVEGEIAGLRQSLHTQEKAAWAAQERRVRQLRWIGIGALIMAVVLGLAWPRVLLRLGSPTACHAMGGEWLRGNETRGYACVFWAGRS